MYQQQPFYRYAERIDYKAIVMDQIQFIHQGLQLGNTKMVMNGILSFEVLLTPMLDEDTRTAIQNLNLDKGREIAQLEKVRPMRRAYERKASGEPDYRELIAQKRFELEQEKYQLLLTFAKDRQLLIAEVETEELA
jgi:hypothetical protein